MTTFTSKPNTLSINRWYVKKNKGVMLIYFYWPTVEKILTHFIVNMINGDHYFKIKCINY